MIRFKLGGAGHQNQGIQGGGGYREKILTHSIAIESKRETKAAALTL